MAWAGMHGQAGPNKEGQLVVEAACPSSDMLAWVEVPIVVMLSDRCSDLNPQSPQQLCYLNYPDVMLYWMRISVGVTRVGFCTRQ
jgi:hypothetical protein